MRCFENDVLLEVILRYYKLIRPASSASIVSSTKSIESLGGVFTIKSLTVRPRLYLDNEATMQSLYLPADHWLSFWLLYASRCARSSGFWVVRLRDIRANKVHLGGAATAYLVVCFG